MGAKDGISQHVKPGTRILDGKYPIATGLEHDEYGHPSGSPKVHMLQNAKRRKKLQALGATLPLPKVYGPPEGNVLLVGWGSTEGPIKEAVDRFRAAGDSVSAIHLRHVNPLPNGTVLMATDACESMGQRLTVGNNSYIAIEADSEEEATTLFNKLSSGGTVEMIPQKMFWGACWGCWADRFGVQWMVNYTYSH